MAALTLPIVPMEKGLSRYFREVWSFPVLEPQEEYMLARRWRQHDDVDAAHKLVTSHLRLVAKIAMNHRGYGLPVADLVSEGNIGLMKAVKKFEPERGFRLSTYAMWWIKAAITEYILRSWSVVKMGTTAAQKKLFFSLRKQKNRLKIMDFGDLDKDQAAELAAVMRVSEKEVVNMNQRLTAPDVSLNAPLSQAEDESLEFQDLLVDEAPSPETQTAESEEGKLRSKFLKQALAKLPERERNILVERRLTDDPVTLKELGKVYGISRERVRQLEVRAFEKVKSLAEVAAGGANRGT
ncbi:MAG: RNA polymerase sigma factor RpoH [Rhodospirillaceae bacterium]|jgi:RNA polymerase sigma-32 factor|nr:RNA polymerase sigma factor RpoH [Rhodospirillaceae bacterium]